MAKLMNNVRNMVLGCLISDQECHYEFVRDSFESEGDTINIHVVEMAVRDLMNNGLPITRCGAYEKAYWTLDECDLHISVR